MPPRQSAMPTPPVPMPTPDGLRSPPAQMPQVTPPRMPPQPAPPVPMPRRLVPEGNESDDRLTRFALRTLGRASRCAALACARGARASAQRHGAAEQQSAQRITPNFKDADITQIAEAVSAATGKNFIIDPRVRAQVTMLSSTPMTPGAVLPGLPLDPAGARLHRRAGRQRHQDRARRQRAPVSRPTTCPTMSARARMRSSPR